MKSIYIITQASAANNYGVGTYYKQLESIFSSTDKFQLIYIQLYSDTNYISLDNNTIFLPKIKYFDIKLKNAEERYFESVAIILKFIITDDDTNYFLFNHSHHYSLIKTMKSFFCNAKFILTIHYLSWVWELKGNTSLYKNIIYGIEKNKYNHILNSYQEELNLFNSLDAIITLSPDTYNLFNKIYTCKTSNIFLIPNGKINNNQKITFEERKQIRHNMNIKDEENIILFVGRFEELKGIDKLLLSFEKVIKRIPTCKLFIAGDGDFSYILSFCKHLWNKVIFTGKIPSDDLNTLYQIADIGVIPSYSEECSYVALEMMMNGLPIITSDARGLRSMFKDRENALFAKIQNYDNDIFFIENIKKCIIELIETPNFKLKLKNNSFSNYRNHYTFNKMCEQYQHIFDRL